MTSDRDFDIVLVGATGFVGRLTAAHLATAGGEVRIALAGRDRGRLEAARAGLPAAAHAWELVVVDVTDEAQAAALAARTAVVCTTVGPYEEYGKALASACADAGTHYCDLAGEVTFVRWSIDTLDAAARRSGARIVHSCGFDSVPSDIGVLETARAAAAAGDGHLTDTVTRVVSLVGGLSGGTIASLRGQVMQATQDREVRRLLAKPYSLAPAGEGVASPAPRPATRRGPVGRVTSALGVDRNPGDGRWTAPFLMASYNTKVVRWSNVASGFSYGRDFRYDEISDAGTGLKGAARAAGVAAMTGVLFGGMAVPPVRAVLDRVLPSPGEGPSEAAMRKGKWRYEIGAVTTSGARYRTTVGDRRDPGYTSTAVMLGESALALAQDDLSEAGRVGLETLAPPAARPTGGAGPSVTNVGGGGVHSPATALGSLLTTRLRAHGFTLETSRVG